LVTLIRAVKSPIDRAVRDVQPEVQACGKLRRA